MAIEFEIKASIDDIRQLESFLKELTFVGSHVETDIYYDDPDRTLFLHAVYLRLRNDRHLDLKYTMDPTDLRHVECTEDRFVYPLDERMTQKISTFLQRYMEATPRDDLFERFCLQPFVRIHKHRATYRGKGMEVVIDSIDGLGHFVEIEASGATPSAIIEQVNILGLNHIPVGYVEMYLRKHNFALYSKGRYLLPGDRL